MVWVVIISKLIFSNQVHRRQDSQPPFQPIGKYPLVIPGINFATMYSLKYFFPVLCFTFVDQHIREPNFVMDSGSFDHLDVLAFSPTVTPRCPAPDP
jgi:hypothetical protein